MGDAAGIGPEIIVKAFEDQQTSEQVKLLVIGDSKIMNKAIALLGSGLRMRTCNSVADADFTSGVMNIIDMDNLATEVFAKGKVNAAAGKAAVEYIKKAVEMALAREIDATTSAPTAIASAPSSMASSTVATGVS